MERVQVTTCSILPDSVPTGPNTHLWGQIFLAKLDTLARQAYVALS